MSSGKHLVVLSVLVTVLLATQGASAVLLNGDFFGEGGDTDRVFDHWALEEECDQSDLARIEPENGPDSVCIHLFAANYVMWEYYGDGSGYHYIMYSPSMAKASNPSDYELYAPAGTTALTFDLMTEIDRNSSVYVEVLYNYDSGAFDQTESIEFTTDMDWTNITLDLPGLDTSKQMSIGIVAQSGFGSTDGPMGEIEAHAYADHFQFIPEPASLLILLGAAPVLLRRRRR